MTDKHILITRDQAAQVMGDNEVFSERDDLAHLHLYELFIELVRILGDAGLMTPEQFVKNLVLVGFSHSSQFGLREPQVYWIQTHMRAYLIPQLVTHEPLRVEVLRHWDANFS